jgi:UDP-N-acetylglucosamine--N-acetylmuramyl-(pentapeptide) pyrophosphoryl-undecaprenol N-acetylglucosamine transferase
MFRAIRGTRKSKTRKEAKTMRILAVGGGSGGHVTPVVAVYKKLRARLDSSLDFRFVVDKKFAPEARELFSEFEDVAISVISAGKWRRYAGIKWWWNFRPYHLVHTHLANFRDLFRIVRGYRQSRKIIRKFRPDVVFVKGGYVSLPVGMAAVRAGVPIVIHDSDIAPGLTNRMLAKVAAAIGTGTPVENYPEYPPELTEFVGIPVAETFFKPLGEKERKKVKESFGLDPAKKMLLVTGGGGGSEFFNETVVAAAKGILAGDINILLLSGKDRKVTDPRLPGLVVKPFVDGLADVVRAADLVVSRAGASSLAELAAAGKAVILIPHPHLASNHQTKNARVYRDAHAAVVMEENKTTPESFARMVVKLMNAPKIRADLGRELHKFARGDALDKMAEMILKVGGYGKK